MIHWTYASSPHAASATLYRRKTHLAPDDRRFGGPDQRWASASSTGRPRKRLILRPASATAAVSRSVSFSNKRASMSMVLRADDRRQPPRTTPSTVTTLERMLPKEKSDGSNRPAAGISADRSR